MNNKELKEVKDRGYCEAQIEGVWTKFDFQGKELNTYDKYNLDLKYLGKEYRYRCVRTDSYGRIQSQVIQSVVCDHIWIKRK